VLLADLNSQLSLIFQSISSSRLLFLVILSILGLSQAPSSVITTNLKSVLLTLLKLMLARLLRLTYGLMKRAVANSSNLFQLMLLTFLVKMNSLPLVVSPELNVNLDVLAQQSVPMSTLLLLSAQLQLSLKILMIFTKKLLPSQSLWTVLISRKTIPKQISLSSVQAATGVSQVWSLLSSWLVFWSVPWSIILSSAS